jgi:hypothetical protein
MMRELLQKANAMNPQFRPICGFQPAFKADADMLTVIMQDSFNSDHFDMVYTGKGVDVFQLDTLVSPNKIRMYDVKLIAARWGKEEWIVVQGLIAAYKDEQVVSQIKRAKIQLIKAINVNWGIDLMKKEA